MKLSDVFDVDTILLLDLPIWVLVNPEIILLVDINLCILIGTVSSVQFALEPLCHQLIVLVLSLVTVIF